MGKLSGISKALQRVSEQPVGSGRQAATRARAAEREWTGNTRKGQLKGLQDYFEHADPTAVRTSAPSPDVIEPTPELLAKPERREGITPKLDLRRRAQDAEELASGYHSFANEMDRDPREMNYFVDANKLKALNDNYGFSVGDRLIELQNQYLRDELAGLDPRVKAIMARGPGDEVFLAGNDDAVMREAIERANHKLITEGVHMDLPGGAKRTISGVASLKYGAGKTLDDAELDMMARKAAGLDDRADASEAIEVIEEPRVRDGSLSQIRKFLNRYEGGLVGMGAKYPDAVEGEYEDGDEYLGEDDEFEYYATGGQVQGYFLGGLKKAVKKGFKKVSKVANLPAKLLSKVPGVKSIAKVVAKAAPALGFIPGVGTLAGGLIGGVAGNIASGGKTSGFLKGALAGASGGIGGGIAKGVAGKLGSGLLAKAAGKVTGEVATGLMGSAMKKLTSDPSGKSLTKEERVALQQGGGQPSQPAVDLAALRQSAMATNAAAPTQLSMVQPQVPRVAPQIPMAGSQGLLQQIQAQQAQNFPRQVA
jgi:GGDEF domain-containing protein